MFPTTRLSLIERIQRGGEQGRQALGEWFNAYLPSIRKIVAKELKYPVDGIDDALSDFISTVVIRRKLLEKYSPQPGKRFRSYLWTAVRYFCIDVNKRGTSTPFRFDESFDHPLLRPPDIFDVLWARQVLGRAIRRMRASCHQQAGSPKRRAWLRAVWGVFEGRFLRPFRSKPQVPYPELVARYGFSSPAVAQKAATEGKRMLAEALISVTSEYAGADDAQTELTDLWDVIRRIRDILGKGRSPSDPDDTDPDESNADD